MSPATKRLLVTAGAVDATLRVAALVDLRRRPSDGVRGPRWAWAVGLSLVSSAGLLPAVYFLRGRVRD